MSQPVPFLAPDAIPQVTFRSERAEDAEFLFRLFASFKDMELAMMPVDDTMKLNLLNHMFRGRSMSRPYANPTTHRDIIEYQGQPVGQFVAERTPERINLIEIIMLPGFRHLGITRHVLRLVKAEACARQIPLRLSVVAYNRVIHLYRRQGFVEVGANGPMIAMEWHPPSS